MLIAVSVFGLLGVTLACELPGVLTWCACRCCRASSVARRGQYENMFPPRSKCLLSKPDGLTRRAGAMAGAMIPTRRFRAKAPAHIRNPLAVLEDQSADEDADGQRGRGMCSSQLAYTMTLFPALDVCI